MAAEDIAAGSVRVMRENLYHRIDEVRGNRVRAEVNVSYDLHFLRKMYTKRLEKYAERGFAPRSGEIARLKGAIAGALAQAATARLMGEGLDAHYDGGNIDDGDNY